MSERFPFSIPNGWFQIAYSDQLRPGDVLPLQYFGKDLVLFRVGSGEVAAVIQEVVRQMNQDIPIWEHKRYLPKPMLCDGDGPIPEYRRWASQFYC